MSSPLWNLLHPSHRSRDAIQSVFTLLVERFSLWIRPSAASVLPLKDQENLQGQAHCLISLPSP
jgi:hypothetical protein